MLELLVSQIRPLRGIRPQDLLAGDIIAPPYDVLSEAEARAIVKQKPRSFLRVTRSEVDLAPGSDAHGAAAYAKARENLDAFVEAGTLIQDEKPCFYLYVQQWQGRTQTGLMALCDTREYAGGQIKKHELTRPVKEQDRVDHVSALDAQSGLVFLTMRDDSETVRAALATAGQKTPAWTVTTDDAVTHSLIVIDDDALISEIQAAFAAVDALYIADGHHRSAAASRVATERHEAGSSRWFLAGIFPDSQLQILAYNRVVSDLNGHTPAAFLSAVGEHFTITPAAAPAPSQRGAWTMYLGGTWHHLSARDGVVPSSDPVGRLDVAVLQDRILAPLLGIENPRTNNRIRFVGGIRGHQALSAAVDAGDAVAFHLYPTGIDQLLDVADASLLMPPKSTWFEPKLRGGVLLHRLI
jgi:uncharacterized protein (DUF1015 family)